MLYTYSLLTRVQQQLPMPVYYTLVAIVGANAFVLTSICNVTAICNVGGCVGVFVCVYARVCVSVHIKV